MPFKTTRTNALLVEAKELPLFLRRIALSLTYWVKFKGSGNEQRSYVIAGSIFKNEKVKDSGGILI